MSFSLSLFLKHLILGQGGWCKSETDNSKHNLQSASFMHSDAYVNYMCTYAISDEKFDHARTAASLTRKKNLLQLIDGFLFLDNVATARKTVSATQDQGEGLVGPAICPRYLPDHN